MANLLTCFYVHLIPTGKLPRSGPLATLPDVGNWIEDNWKIGETKSAKISTEFKNAEKLLENYKIEENALKSRLKFLEKDSAAIKELQSRAKAKAPEEKVE